MSDETFCLIIAVICVGLASVTIATLDFKLHDCRQLIKEQQK